MSSEIVENSVVDLNVGGLLYTTSINTLTKVYTDMILHQTRRSVIQKLYLGNGEIHVRVHHPMTFNI